MALLSFVVTLLSVGLTGAELVNRVWGIGPAPSDIATDLFDRATTSDDPPLQPVSTDDSEFFEQFETASEAIQEGADGMSDGDPPAAPRNLRVETQDGCIVTLAWDPVDDPDLDGYFVDNLGGVKSFVERPRTKLEVTLVPGRSATYVVQSVEGTEASDDSNEISIIC